MIDCAKDLARYHDDQVTLSVPQQTTMRERRDINRQRLKAGLTATGKPQPYLIASQGSYAMKTMVQSVVADIDIDDGVYFEATQLVGAQGAAMSALQVRQMLANALTDSSGNFNKQPEVRDNCVRIYYADGYHIDVPGYRRKAPAGLLMAEHLELASVDWKPADARAVTDWFEGEVKRLSPVNDVDQLRRVVRMLKKFVRNRPSWKGKTASGFCITKLVTERFSPNSARDDLALRHTASAIYQRLLESTVVHHPIIDENITSGNPDPKTAYFRDRLVESLRHLEVLDNSTCSRPDARKAWDKFFATDWFSKLPDDGGSKGPSGSGGPYIVGGATPPAVEKKGGHGYA